MKRKSSEIKRGLGLLVAWSFCIQGAWAQQIQFAASVSSSRVTQNAVFEVQFELQNAKGTDFRPPTFEGFKVVGGPAIGSSTTIINGAVSQSQSWSYSLLAIRQGTFTIGSASVVAGRKKRMSQPLNIEVTAPRESATPQGDGAREPVLLKAEIPEGPFYPGQQILLNYRLLFRENVQTVSTLSEDDYADFFIQHFHEIPTEATYETVDGVTFTSRVVKAIALFAHQSGTFTIDPMVMSVGINAPFPGMHGFFTMRRIQDIQVASEPITISVRPLPSDAPEGFTGAVGQYTLETFALQTQITTDDALTFRLRFTGDGDARRWDLPTPVTNGAFDVYEPKVTDDQIAGAGTHMAHVRTGEYQLIPASAGTFNVYVPFTYFDPVSGLYTTISSDTLHIMVAQGQMKTGAITSRDTADTGSLSLMPVRSVFLQDRFWVSWPHLLLFGLILSGATWGWLVTWRRKHEDEISGTDKLKKQAADKALQKLEPLNREHADMTAKAFFETTTEIFYTFLQERFSIPASELDEAGLLRHLKQAGIADDITKETQQFFHQCLSVRYGGVPGGFTREEMLQACQRIIGMLPA